MIPFSLGQFIAWMAAASPSMCLTSGLDGSDCGGWRG